MSTQAPSAPVTELDLLERVFSHADPMSEEAARTFLALRLSPADKKRMSQLLRLNNAGKITAPERLELDRWVRVGGFLDLMHVRAKLVLSNPVES